jgi:hypothetical protein
MVETVLFRKDTAMLEDRIPVPLTDPERAAPPDEGARRGGPGRRTWRDYSTYLAAAAATALLVVAVWLSSEVDVGVAWHDIALFTHLASLVVGFGAVLVADYFFALWLFGRLTFAEAVRGTSRLHLLVWSGLTGLVASGTLLQPDLRSPVTVLKLVFVLGLTVNGVHTLVLGRRMALLAGNPPRGLLVRGGLATAVSQICWWGAVVIGFLNANH